MHIYAFGSVCRGEVKYNSDIDLLVLTSEYDDRFDPAVYSIYSYNRISELWKEGNPFAWHLAFESRMIYSFDGKDYIKSLGEPSEYSKCREDCFKFYNLYCDAITSINSGCNSMIFDLSSIFLAIRNFATCYSLGKLNIRNFSRNSALNIMDKSLEISKGTYELLEASRILSTRGKGDFYHFNNIKSSMEEIMSIKNWMENLLREVDYHR